MATRRVVTGLGHDGTARVVSDGPAPHVLTDERAPGYETVQLWATDDVPAVPCDGTDPTGPGQAFFPRPRGSRFFVSVFPAGMGTAPPDGSASPERIHSHVTRTVDYGIVLHGELTLVLDSGDEVTLRAGDTVVQNGTMHGWRNSSGAPATIAFVVLGAEEAAP
ncbi:cupin domain-containing protein [Prauserella sp. PE36]|uniref:cupin domain-containing protein n=1 Tax=Prauserella sp. PE36 TaxID=1504709 RepID=UPI000DE1B342|nr:cupin domain-containing protein [Prauserella sp. PE36]RBM21984.1 cupin domain-containing protein [Prauserella sp. PE36]